MKCKISNCNHHIRRGINSQKRLSDSWRKYGICVCCANIIQRWGVIEEYFCKSNVCSQALRMEKYYNRKGKKNEWNVMPRNRSPFNMITIYAYLEN